MIFPEDSIAYLPGWFAFDFEGGGTGILAVFDLAEGFGSGNGQADCVSTGEGKGIGVFFYKLAIGGAKSIVFFGRGVLDGRGIIFVELQPIGKVRPPLDNLTVFDGSAA